MVSGCKATSFFWSVFHHPALDVIRHTRVKNCVVRVGHDVYAVFLLDHLYFLCHCFFCNCFFCHCEPLRGEAISRHVRKDFFVEQRAPSSQWQNLKPSTREGNKWGSLQIVTMFWYRYKLSDLTTDNPGILNVLFRPNSLRSLRLSISLFLISIGHSYFATLGHYHFALTQIAKGGYHFKADW